MDIDPTIFASLFGEDMLRSDATRQSSGDVSETGKALEGPGGPYDDEILAVVEQDGVQEPARLSPGEFVFKQPATVYLGEGDEKMGAAYLDILQNNPDALDEVREVLKKYAG